ncbi:hypothetical protein [Paenibacillus montanisoli]|uniref:DUF2642 domain-containing protein n=1 Tax=Paenibacillus montanisoli TaxID=2081970 RepID=A0A328TUX7_9BACL|nr:hypothetical protein [Paenibacillus montanisoli]RAP74150.1 hypothetical protein DL346_24080 [Paenibacillus montanisoli]
MNELLPYLAENMIVEVTGKQLLPGKLVDVGPDILVLYHQDRYLYIPTAHVYSLKPDAVGSDDSIGGTDEPSVLLHTDPITLSSVLQEAKGLFVEIYVSGSKPIHGYLHGIMNDFLVIHSPIYNAVYVSTRHMKWLIPYPTSHIPYARSVDKMSMKPLAPVGAGSFEDLCKKEEGNMVVMDVGGQTAKLGVIKKVNSGIIDFIDANGSNKLINVHHVKTMYAPK